MLKPVSGSNDVALDLNSSVLYNPMQDYLQDNPGPFSKADFLTDPSGEAVYHLRLRPDQLARSIIKLVIQAELLQCQSVFSLRG